jgi:hypothetical protein
MKKVGFDRGPVGIWLIDKRSAELGDWRGETSSRMRKLIKEADPFPFLSSPLTVQTFWSFLTLSLDFGPSCESHPIADQRRT